MAITDQTGGTPDAKGMPAVRRAGMADGGERSGAEHTLRVVHEEVLDEAQLAAVAGGSTDPQTSSRRITVTSEGLIGGIRIIGGRLDTEPNTLCARRQPGPSKAYRS